MIPEVTPDAVRVHGVTLQIDGQFSIHRHSIAGLGHSPKGSERAHPLATKDTIRISFLGTTEDIILSGCRASFEKMLDVFEGQA